MDPVALLEQLVALPSVNPMGRPVSGPEYFEGRVTQFLLEFFRTLNVPHAALEVLPGRCNVIARWDHPGSRTTLLLDAHQDTVPVDGMTIEPFRPVIREGRLYGRGACDVKGGLAAILAAFARLVQERPAGAPHVVVSCTCDEESTAQGVTALARMWSTDAPRHPLLPQPPDLALVAEPTDLDIVVAHRGATRWKIRTRGKACHSSQPEQGVNAIYKMGAVLRELEVYARELPGSKPPHPLCGPATLSVGRIDGGLSVNTVPDECTIEIDRRCIPGEDGLQVMTDVADWLQSRLGKEAFEMLPPWLVGMSLSDHNNGPWADRLMGVIRDVVGERRKVGVPYGTNASRIAATGVPAVVFGPGSIRQAHTVDEWISLDELRQGTEIFYRFCATAGQT